VSAALRTRLKIADLTAWTALDTGRRLLPHGFSLERLVREEFFLFEPARGFAADAFEKPLLHAIERSNFFVNPNKEQFRFLSSGERGVSLDPLAGAWGILARPREGTEDVGLLERLLREHPMEGLGAIRRARIWWLWTRGPGGGSESKACYEVLGPVRGPAQGLLANVHSEATLLFEGAVSWRVIESFLTEPVPAIGAAA
jgi:hypothetical protein